jgi:hypothetical protein
MGFRASGQDWREPGVKGGPFSWLFVGGRLNGGIISVKIIGRIGLYL